MAQIPREVGRRFIVGLSGTRLTKGEAEFLSRLSPGGIILRGPNVEQKAPYAEWRTTLQSLIEDARRAAGRETFIVAIDHEGGRVHRLPPPITHFPPAARWSQSPRAVAHAMGTELRALGFNVVFGPVADIHSNLDNPVIGTRSFGTTASAVSAAAVAAVHGFLDAGIVPVAKHFPGHGDTHQDSHEELPSLPHPLEQLRSRELQPFAALVQDGIPCIMTAHIMFPALDPTFPATLSQKILTGLLRETLGFQGVVITDDCDMKAITTRFRDEEVAEQLFSAGVDLVLCNHDQPRAERLATIVAERKAQSETFAELLTRREQMLDRFFADTIQAPSFRELTTAELANHDALRASVT